jgi:sulfide:quinone oxidoreductase
MKRHVVILGAGFAGLELATRLSETVADAVEVTLIDRNDSFYFGFSKLEVMLGRQSAEEVKLPYAEVVKEGVTFRREAVVGIDPERRRVVTDAGATYDADFLVVAMGADYDIPATPGFAEGGFEYYTLDGAERLRDALTTFTGGRVLLSVLGQPFKCPPAPFEGAFMLDEHFREQGIRDDVDLTIAFPMQRPVPVTGEVSQMFRDGLAARGITERAQTRVTGIDPATGTAGTEGGETLDYDLFVGIPLHRAPDPLAASGLAVNGWVPVDQANLRTSYTNVYALGDVSSGPRNVPKAGIFAESAALVVADDIAAQVTGADAPAPYEGSGVCYAEFGGGLVGKVEVAFLRGDAPEAQRHEPALAFAAEKDDFGATRRARWFGRAS